MGKDEKRSSRTPKTKTAKSAAPKATAKAKTASAKAPKTSAKRVKSATAPMKAVRPSKAAAAKVLDPAQRDRMIAEAAYYLAERRHFAPGCEVEDWLAAERAIDQTLAN